MISWFLWRCFPGCFVGCGEASGLGMVRQYRGALLPSPRVCGGEGSGGGGLSAGAADSEYAEPPPTPDP